MTSVPPNASPSVLVVGAGPSGLVLALTLRKHGANVRIIEKSTEPQIGSRGSGMMPRTQEIFHFLGIMEDIRELGSRIPPMRSYKPPGGTIPLDTWKILEDLPETSSKPYRHAIELRQELLEGILRKHLFQHGTAVEFDTQLHSFRQDGDGVMARLQKSTLLGDLDVVRTTYLVGADGARGVVRRLLGLTFLGETREADEMIVGDVEIDGLTRDFWHLWGSKESNQVITVRPCGKEQTRFAIFSTGSFIREADMSNPDNFRSFFARHTGRRDLVLRQFHWLSYFRPSIRMVNKFGEGRVFVVGDAAHVHPPTGGQGMNSSVQDSFNLAWKLAFSLRQPTPPSSPSPTTMSSSLLASYTFERLPVIAEMLRQTETLHNETFKGGDVTRKQIGWTRGQHLYLLDVNYRWSEIVRDERSPRSDLDDIGGGGCSSADGVDKEIDRLKDRAYWTDDERLRAGDRAPDAPGIIEVHARTGSTSPPSTSIFNLLNVTRHSIFIFPTDVSVAGLGFVESIVTSVSRLPRNMAQAILVLPSGAPPVTIPRNPVLQTFIDKEGSAHAAYQIVYGERSGIKRTTVIVRPDAVVGAVVHSADGLVKYFAKIMGAR